jgi:preprotein translocase subunit Sss1
VIGAIRLAQDIESFLEALLRVSDMAKFPLKTEI